MPRRPLKIYSWNVNGIRACARKGFLDFLKAHRPWLLGVQETRARPEQVDEEVLSPRGYSTHFVAAERPGYSGVALYAREAPNEVEVELGHSAMDAEGRLQIARFGELTVANVYFPNGSGKQRDNSRVPFKLDFYRRLRERLDAGLDAGEKILVMGDFNTAHREIDLARPKQNTKTSGFLEEEREELDVWLDRGWVDTFRAFEGEGGHYTWWSQRRGVRERNVGWRIDYILASEAAMPYVRGAEILPHVHGSDHCPIRVDVDPAAIGGSAR